MADPYIGGNANEAFTLKKFIPDEHDLANKIILIIGPRESGKTFLTIDLLSNLDRKYKLPFGMIINGSEEVTGTYKAYAPDIIIYDDFNKESFKKFFDRQKDITHRKKFDPKWKNVDNRAFLIIDDLYYKRKSWLKDPNLQYCLNNGRHIGLTIIFAIQGLTEIPTNFKDVVDYVFLGRMVTKKQKDYVFNHYSCGFDDFKRFCKAINRGTEDNRFMVFHKTSKKNNFNNQVWWYKAEPHYDLHLCHPKIWQYHGKKYDKKYSQRKEEEAKARNQMEKLKEKMKRGSSRSDIVLIK